MLKQRIITAAILAAVFFAALFGLPTLWFGALCLVALVAGVDEWVKLTGLPRSAGIALSVLFVATGGALLFGHLYTPGAGFPPLLLGAVCAFAAIFWIAVATLWLRNGWPTRKGLPVAILGTLLLFAFWMALVGLHARSPWLLLGTMAIVWIADTAAYFAGRAFGKRKLAPSISPGKSWEGVYGGLTAVGVYVVVLLASGVLPAGSVPRAAAIVAGALFLGALSVVGDLFESWLKRQAGVKDSGTLLPGHGGVLDRIDALLPALPLATLFVMAMS